MSTTDQDAAVPTTIAARRPEQPSATELLASTVAEAALAVDGVHRLGTPAGRAIASIRTTATGRQFAPGVRIDQLTGAVQIDVVAEYPVDLIEVAGRVRSAVAAVAGVDGVRVDVLVTDVHGPFDREQPEGDPMAGPKAAVAAAADAADAGAAAAADAAKAGADAVADSAKEAADTVADTARAGAGAVADGAALVAERARAVADDVKAASEATDADAAAREDADAARAATPTDVAVTADTVVIVVEPEVADEDGGERKDGAR